MYTFLLASKYFTSTFAFAAPSSTLLYRAQYKTGSESTLRRSHPPESGPSARRIFTNSVPPSHISLILRESACLFFFFVVFVCLLVCSLAFSDHFQFLSPRSFVWRLCSFVVFSAFLLRRLLSPGSGSSLTESYRFPFSGD